MLPRKRGRRAEADDLAEAVDQPPERRSRRSDEVFPTPFKPTLTLATVTPKAQGEGWV